MTELQAAAFIDSIMFLAGVVGALIFATTWKG